MPPKFQLQAATASSSPFDVLIVLLSPEQLGTPGVLDDSSFAPDLERHLAEIEFKAERNSSLIIPTLGRGPAKHLVVVGTGARVEGVIPTTALAEALAVAVRSAPVCGVNGDDQTRRTIGGRRR